jgi:glycosyltransferase involved in cell wall biosynthesis
LAKELEQEGNIVSLVRVLDRREDPSPSRIPVIGQLIASEPDTIDSSVRVLNQCDVVIIQHEYGLYGGADGQDVLKVMHKLRAPTIVVLHTVLSSPTQHQREVLNDVLCSVDVAVVMTESAARTLQEGFEVGDTPVCVIPHGATVVANLRRRRDVLRPTALTWGLLGPGKGIEWVIDSLVGLKELVPTPLYIVAGRTHPKVLARDGEQYRQGLAQRALDLGVSHMVHFDNTYRDLLSLTSLIETADVVVLPYDSKDQATSGVLVDAIAAGKPVIATRFPHAVEQLGSGAGILVHRKDSDALGAALTEFFSNSVLAEQMAREARRLALGLSWECVGRQYAGLNELLFGRIDVPE